MTESDREPLTLCGASWYNQKYYLNPQFARLPQKVRDELQILCVSFTEEVGGILTLVFSDEGELEFEVRSAEGDPRFDEVGSGLLIGKLRREKQELLQQLELYYRLVVRNGMTGARETEE